jgi:hypothetical protein
MVVVMVVLGIRRQAKAQLVMVRVMTAMVALVVREPQAVVVTLAMTTKWVA